MSHSISRYCTSIIFYYSSNLKNRSDASQCKAIVLAGPVECSKFRSTFVRSYARTPRKFLTVWADCDVIGSPEKKMSILLKYPTLIMYTSFNQRRDFIL